MALLDRLGNPARVFSIGTRPARPLGFGLAPGLDLRGQVVSSPRRPRRSQTELGTGGHDGPTACDPANGPVADSVARSIKERRGPILGARQHEPIAAGRGRPFSGRGRPGLPVLLHGSPLRPGGGRCLMVVDGAALRPPGQSGSPGPPDQGVRLAYGDEPEASREGLALPDAPPRAEPLGTHVRPAPRLDEDLPTTRHEAPLLGDPRLAKAAGEPPRAGPGDLLPALPLPARSDAARRLDLLQHGRLRLLLVVPPRGRPRPGTPGRA